MKRFAGNPILEPRGDDWESVEVFNPSAIYIDGKIHVYYRAVGDYFPATSRLGYAIFDKDLNLLERQSEPVMIPDERMWEWSLEDPRVTEIEGDIYLTYVVTTPTPTNEVRKKLGIPKPGPTAQPRTAVAKVKNFREFERYGFITPYGADERDVVLFPEKIGGKYALLHRPHNWVGEEYGTAGPSIWYATTDSLDQKIADHKVVMKAEAEWEGSKLGSGPPPIKTDSGWLLIYHSVDKNKVYRAGAALLDLEEPWKVLARTREPILEPIEDYEKYGDVPNVVFPEGMVVVDKSLIVFYGCADKACSVASIDLDEFIEDLLSEEK